MHDGSVVEIEELAALVAHVGVLSIDWPRMSDAMLPLITTMTGMSRSTTTMRTTPTMDRST